MNPRAFGTGAFLIYSSNKGRTGTAALPATSLVIQQKTPPNRGV